MQIKLYIIITASTSSIKLQRMANKVVSWKCKILFTSHLIDVLLRFTMRFQKNPIKYNLLNVKAWLGFIIFRSDHLKLSLNVHLYRLLKANKSTQIRSSCVHIVANIWICAVWSQLSYVWHVHSGSASQAAKI